jgi:hypothetical protein
MKKKKKKKKRIHHQSAQTVLECKIACPHPKGPIITGKTGHIQLTCVAPVYSPGMPWISERLPSLFSDVTPYLVIVEKQCVPLSTSNE